MKSALIGLATLALAAPAHAQDHTHTQGGSPLSEPGQGAFAAIQEVVTRLSADPATDWSRVNVEALRQHLIDMDELILRANIQTEPIQGGARFRVTGAGRTREAIQRMITSHVRSMGEAEHWRLSFERSGDGAVVTAIGREPEDAQRIRSLGLSGIMAEGAHHQAHHWMMATGADPHR